MARTRETDTHVRHNPGDAGSQNDKTEKKETLPLFAAEGRPLALRTGIRAGAAGSRLLEERAKRENANK